MFISSYFCIQKRLNGNYKQYSHIGPCVNQDRKNPNNMTLKESPILCTAFWVINLDTNKARQICSSETNLRKIARFG